MDCFASLAMTAETLSSAASRKTIMSVDWTDLLHTFEFVSVGQPGEHEALSFAGKPANFSGSPTWTKISKHGRTMPTTRKNISRSLTRRNSISANRWSSSSPDNFFPTNSMNSGGYSPSAAPMRGSRISCNEGKPSIDGTISRPGQLKRPYGNGAKPTA